MPKSIAIKSLEQTLSLVDEQILPVEDRQAIIDIIERSKQKADIATKREEHYELLADLIAFNTTYRLKLAVLNLTVQKQIERVSKLYELANGGKSLSEHRAKAAVADDDTASFYITLKDSVAALCTGLEYYIDSFKQRSYALHEESKETSKYRELARTDY